MALRTLWILAYRAERLDLTQVLQDYEYLTPVIKEVEAERTEREDLESMVITKRKQSAKDSTKH